jgi:hypothetical protein
MEVDCAVGRGGSSGRADSQACHRGEGEGLQMISRDRGTGPRDG